MNFLIDTKNRSEAIEIMDDFSMEGEHLYNTLDQLATINKWLGGNHVTLNALKKILKNHPKHKKLTIVDLGCGNGDMLRIVSDYLKRNNYNFKLIGVDANSYTINYAKELSKEYPEITYLQQDIFSDEFKSLEYDLVLATLFLHHFKEDQLIELLSNQLRKAKLGVLVNDLHRHKLAYYLFKGLSLFIKNPMVKQDGLTSILRGFKRKDLEKMSKQLNVKSELNWKWAFRFQWILKKVRG
ncbi:methyltransferase domain-containing protein [Aureibaculum sp. 2210JD6-5]|uniref:methyltransferase domain-containing protein n=1 Tax=Aureibaculum sp. 2210JD6-5 TaxID=3103957 RepID=UPI002AAD0442|nr:methyltransferase domain-containing protein [Aureibaculum sp. 2210JD6-5]MDY7395772.1 methyltransferase domain-containing protein [Aureibaculum sp. 2210JD6-5]